jgi:hypothetical protein
MEATVLVAGLDFELSSERSTTYISAKLLCWNVRGRIHDQALLQSLVILSPGKDHNYELSQLRALERDYELKEKLKFDSEGGVVLIFSSETRKPPDVGCSYVVYHHGKRADRRRDQTYL